MRILFVAPRFHTNQVEIVRTLQKKGHEVRFFVSLTSDSEDHTDLQPLVLEESGLSRLLRKWFGDGGVNRRRSFPRVRDCYRSMREFSPDVVIIRFHGMVFSYLAAICARLITCKVVFYEQVNPHVLEQQHRGWGRGFLRKAHFYARLFLFRASWMTPLPSSNDETAQLPRGCYFVPFAVPVTNQPKVPNVVVHFLVVGKYQLRKNHLLMLEAASQLTERYDFRITFVGEVSTPAHSEMRVRVEEAAVTLGLTGKVFFLDNVPFAQMVALYRTHDVFILPASHEPASVSLLEALGQGVPAVCSDSCGTRTYIRDGLGGFVFSADDTESLRTVLEQFLSRPEICTSMSEEALKAAHNTVSPEAFYQRFMAMVAGPQTMNETASDIAFILDCGMGGGGAERVASRLMSAWTASGKKVTMITMNPPANDWYPEPPDIQRVVLGAEMPPRNKMEALLRNIGDVFRLRRVLRDLDAPVIISFLTIPNIRTVLAGACLGKRIIISERNDPTQEKRSWFWHLMRRGVYRFASIVTANSQVALDHMAHYVPAHKLAYVPNPVEPPMLTASPEESRIILSVGRLVEQKNHALLVEAFSALRDLHQEWAVDILGQGPEEARLASLIDEKGLTGTVRLRGMVSDTEPHYQSAGIFVLSSLYEGTPNAMLEAMAHGLPCVVADNLPGALTHIEDGVTGLVFRSGNPQSLAAKLAHLIHDPVLRKQLGEAGRQRTLPFMTDKVVAIWDKLGVSECAD